LPEEKIFIVYVLSEALQSLTLSELSELASVKPLSAWRVIHDWLQFLHELPPADNPRYAIYHASFREFLHRHDIVRAARLSLPEVHSRIVRALAEADNLEPLAPRQADDE